MAGDSFTKVGELFDFSWGDTSRTITQFEKRSKASSKRSDSDQICKLSDRDRGALKCNVGKIKNHLLSSWLCVIWQDFSSALRRAKSIKSVAKEFIFFLMWSETSLSEMHSNNLVLPLRSRDSEILRCGREWCEVSLMICCPYLNVLLFIYVCNFSFSVRSHIVCHNTVLHLAVEGEESENLISLLIGDKTSVPMHHDRFHINLMSHFLNLFLFIIFICFIVIFWIYFSFIITNFSF